MITEAPATSADFVKKPKDLYLSLFKLFLAIFGIFTAFGFSDISILMMLKNRGISDTFTSMNVSLYLLGYTLGCFLLIPFLKKYSAKLLIFSVIVGILLSLIFFALADYILLLIGWYFLQGVCASMVVIIFSHLITTISSPLKNKELLIGLFVSVMTAGYVLGVESVAFFSGGFSLPPFLIITCFTTCLVLPFLFSQDIHKTMALVVEEMAESPVSFPRALINLICMPVACFSVIMYGINNSVTVEMISVWGIDSGYGEKKAVFLAIPILIGGVLLPSFFSKFYKAWGGFKTALFYTAMLGLFMFLLHIAVVDFASLKGIIKKPLFFGIPAFPVLFLAGGFIFSFKSLYLCILSDQFQGAMLAASCAAAYCLAHLTGAIFFPLCGYIMSKTGYTSFGLFLIGAYSFFTILLLLQKRK